MMVSYTEDAFDILAKWNSTEIPSDPGYHIFYNFTAPNAFVPELIKLLSESILTMKSGRCPRMMDIDLSQGVQADLNISLRNYPTKNRFASYNVVAQSGATWFFVPPVLPHFDSN